MKQAVGWKSKFALDRNSKVVANVTYYEVSSNKFHINKVISSHGMCLMLLSKNIFLTCKETTTYDMFTSVIQLYPSNENERCGIITRGDWTRYQFINFKYPVLNPYSRHMLTEL